MNRDPLAVHLKIAAPIAHQALLPRPRLLALLDRAVVKPLTVMAAPAGYGKTSLLTQWTQACSLPTAWLTLDTDDCDGMRLARYLRAALQLPLPKLGLPQTTPHALNHDHDENLIDEHLQMLAGEVGQAGTNVVLVVDEHHSAGAAKALGVLTRFLRLAPRNLHAIVAVRDASGLPPDGWSARAGVSQIGAAELTFTAQEAAAHLEAALGPEPQQTWTQGLTEAAEGWIAGLQLTVLAHLQDRRHFDARKADMGRTRARYLEDYFWTEVLAGLAPDMLAFLRKICVLSRFCASLCDELVVGVDGARMLAELEVRGLFVARIDKAGGWYRMHGLLATTLAAGLDDEVRDALLRSAARWFESRHLAEDALAYALLARDDRACARLIRAELGRSLNRCDNAALLARLNQLPEESIVGNADLVALKAWTLHLAGAAEDAARYTELAMCGIGSVQGQSSALRSTFGAYLAWLEGDAARTEMMATRALEHIGDESDWLRLLALSYLGQAQAALGQRRTAIVTLSDALIVDQAIGGHSRALDALFHLVMLMRGQGRLREAMALCQEAINRHVDPQGQPLPASGRTHVALAWLHFDCNDLVSARDSLAVGLRLCDASASMFYTVVGIKLTATLELAAGQTEKAFAALEQARAMPGSRSRTRQFHIAAMAADIHLRLGRAAPAARLLGPVAALDIERVPEELAMLHARLLLMQDASKALDFLGHLETIARRDHFTGSLVGIQVLQAVGRQTLGDAAASQDLIESARRLAEETGHRRVFVEHGAALAAIRVGRNDLVDGFEDAPPEGMGSISLPTHQPAPLSHREVEILRLLGLGLRNDEIAQELSITAGTATQCVHRLFNKLGARNRIEAVAKGNDSRLLA